MKQINKKRIILAIFFAFLFFSFSFFLQSSSFAADPFIYKALETIPGVTAKGADAPNFNEYVADIYMFLISVIGICALFMITVGGYMYITSAGNATVLSQAKSIITDAIIGLIIALLTYLIFYTINPALVSPSGLQSIPTL